MLPALRKAGATAKKSTATARAPMSAPTSGRPRMLAAAERVTTRSSAGVVVRVAISDHLPPSSATSTRAVGGELGDLRDVRLVDERRPGRDVLPAAERVAVRLVEPQRVDRLVTLQVGLLVDGPVDGAVLDGRDELLVGVEGADLRRAAGLLDRLHRVEGERGPQGHDPVDALVLGQLGLDVRRHRGVVAAVDVRLADLRPAARPGGHAVAAVLELLLTLLLDDAEDVLAAVRHDALAHGGAGVLLALPEVAEGAEPERVRAARVEHRHGDARGDRLLDGGAERSRVRVGHGDAVDLLVDRRLDQLRLLAGVRVVGVLEVDVVLGRGGLAALADDVPERVAGCLMGDHGDRHLRCVRDAGIGRRRGLRGLLATGRRAGREGEGGADGHGREREGLRAIHGDRLSDGTVGTVWWGGWMGRNR